MDSRDSIVVECPKCFASLNASSEQFGQSVRCTVCKERFVVTSFRAADRGQLKVSRKRERSKTPTPASGSTRGGSDTKPSDVAKRRKIGRFEVTEKLGGGGFGLVYLAIDPVLNRRVALKVPRFSAKDEKRIRRFVAEAKSAARLHHPNIVAVFDSGRTDDGTYFIASEYVDGRPLSAFVDAPDQEDCETVDLRTKASWIRDLALSLAYSHGEGIVHRDIKPDNILVDSQHQRPRITDFGLAKQLGQSSSVQTQDGSILGTPAYMSPEQARGQIASVGPASDQYSLGVIFYELLCHRRPYEGQLPQILAALTGENETPLLKAQTQDVPKDLEAIANKAVSKRMEDRYESCNEFAADLTAWLDGEPVRARPLGVPVRLFRWAKRNPTIAGLAATIVLIASMAFVAVTQSLSVATTAQREAEASADQLRTTLNTLAEEKRRADEAKADAEANATELQQAVEELQSQKTQLEIQKQEIEQEQNEKASALAQLDRAQRSDLKSTRRAQLAVYRPNVMLGYREQREANLEAARRFLADCPENLKGWEWHFADKLVRSSTLPNDISDLCKAIRFDPTGHYLAVATQSDVTEIAETFLIDVKTKRILHRLESPKEFDSAEWKSNRDPVERKLWFSPDGNRLLSIWHVLNSRETKPMIAAIFDTNEGRILSSVQAKFSPPDRWLCDDDLSVIALFEEKRIKPVYQIVDDKFLSLTEGSIIGIGGKAIASRSYQRSQLPTGWSAFRDFRFSSDGGHIIELESNRFGSNHKNRRTIHSLKITPVSVGPPRTYRLEGIEGDLFPNISSYDYHAPTSTFLFALFDGKVKKHMIPAGNMRNGVIDVARAETIEAHNGKRSQLTMSPDGKHFATHVKGNTVKIWRTEDMNLLAAYGGPTKPIKRLAFSPSGNYVGFTTFEESVHRLEIQSIATEGNSIIHAALNGHTLNVLNADRVVRQFDIRLSPPKLVNPRLCEIKDALNESQFDQTGTLLTAINSRSFIICRSVASKPEILLSRVSGYPATPWRPAAHGEKRLFAYGDSLINFETNTVTKFDWFKPQSVARARFSRDGTLLAHIQNDEEGKSMIRVIDTSSGAQIETIESSPVVAVEFSPDNSSIAYATSDQSCFIKQLGSDDRVEIRGLRARIRHIRILPDASRLFTAGDDGSVRVWDTITGEEMLTLTQLDSSVAALDLSNDGRYLVACSRLGKIKVFDAGVASVVEPKPTVDASNVRQSSTLSADVTSTAETDGTTKAEYERLQAMLYSAIKHSDTGLISQIEHTLKTVEGGDPALTGIKQLLADYRAMEDYPEDLSEWKTKVLTQRDLFTNPVGIDEDVGENLRGYLSELRDPSRRGGPYRGFAIIRLFLENKTPDEALLRIEPSSKSGWLLRWSGNAIIRDNDMVLLYAKEPGQLQVKVYSSQHPAANVLVPLREKGIARIPVYLREANSADYASVTFKLVPTRTTDLSTTDLSTGRIEVRRNMQYYSQQTKVATYLLDENGATAPLRFMPGHYQAFSFLPDLPGGHRNFEVLESVRGRDKTVRIPVGRVTDVQAAVEWAFRSGPDDEWRLGQSELSWRYPRKKSQWWHAEEWESDGAQALSLSLFYRNGQATLSSGQDVSIAKVRLYSWPPRANSKATHVPSRANYVEVETGTVVKIWCGRLEAYLRVKEIRIR